MVDAAAEEEGHAIGSEPPHRGPDTERWPLGRHNLQLDRASDFQLGLGSDLGAKRAEVQGARQVAVRSRMDENGPGNASAGVLPPVLLLRSVHEHNEWQLVCQPKRHNEDGSLGTDDRHTVRFDSDVTSHAQHVVVPTTPGALIGHVTSRTPPLFLCAYIGNELQVKRHRLETALARGAHRRQAHQ
jgi:hypothetical protein